MNFYETLQKDPMTLKRMIKENNNRKERHHLRLMMFLRSILLVAFAIVFIASLSAVFGEENNAMAVSMFCILLAIRFVDFGYCIKDALINLTIVFLLLLISPSLAHAANPMLAFLIHIVSVFIILLITCDKPEMGNGGLYSFAYIFLSGNPVESELLFKRFLMTIVCLFICGVIFYKKHHTKHTDVRFREKLQEFNFYTHKYQWQIRMSLGVALILTLGAVFHIERYMWMGFACGSLLSDYSFESKMKEKFKQRLIGVVAGSILFYIVYTLLPHPMHSIIGIFGGILLGLCTQYKHKTALNCLGALMVASGIYGIQGAIVLRITDNLMGILFAVVFFFLYEFFIGKYCRKKAA